MGRNQFSFQKRQKELAKKKKQDEKRARRAERKELGNSGPEIAQVNEFGEVIEPEIVDDEDDDDALEDEARD